MIGRVIVHMVELSFQEFRLKPPGSEPSNYMVSFSDLASSNLSHLISINYLVWGQGPTMSNKDFYHPGKSKGLEVSSQKQGQRLDPSFDSSFTVIGR